MKRWCAKNFILTYPNRDVAIVGGRKLTIVDSTANVADVLFDTVEILHFSSQRL